MGVTARLGHHAAVLLGFPASLGAVLHDLVAGDLLARFAALFTHFSAGRVGVVRHRAAAGREVGRQRTEPLAVHRHLVGPGVGLLVGAALSELLQAVVRRLAARLPAIVQSLAVLVRLLRQGVAARATKPAALAPRTPSMLRRSIFVLLCC